MLNKVEHPRSKELLLNGWHLQKKYRFSEEKVLREVFITIPLLNYIS